MLREASEKMGYPCVGFEMEYVRDAVDHFRGNLELVKDYGGCCGDNLLHEWDDGRRVLFRCKACGGYILKQYSEYHSFSGDDSATAYYFPVSGPEEAAELNRTLNGEAIVRDFKGNYIEEDCERRFFIWREEKKHDWGKPLEGEAKELLDALVALNDEGPASSAIDLEELRAALEAHAPFPEADTVNGRFAGASGLAIGVFLRERMGNPGSVRQEVWEFLIDYVVEVEMSVLRAMSYRAMMIAWLLPDLDLFERYIDKCECLYAKSSRRASCVHHLIPALLMNHISKTERGRSCTMRFFSLFSLQYRWVFSGYSILSAEEYKALASIRGTDGKSLFEHDREWCSQSMTIKSAALKLFERFPHDGQDVKERLKEYRRCQDAIRSAFVRGGNKLLQEDLDWIDDYWDEHWPDLPAGIGLCLAEAKENRRRASGASAITVAREA